MEMIMRGVLAATLVFAAATAGTAAYAQADYGQYRTRTVMVFGDDPCPVANNPDEIIVCARRPEDERYRIPKELRDAERAEKIAREDNVGAQRNDLVSGRASASGIGSCSASGAAGVTGCNQGLDVFKAGKTVVEGVKTAIEPIDD